MIVLGIYNNLYLHWLGTSKRCSASNMYNMTKLDRGMEVNGIWNDKHSNWKSREWVTIRKFEIIDIVRSSAHASSLKLLLSNSLGRLRKNVKFKSKERIVYFILNYSMTKSSNHLITDGVQFLTMTGAKLGNTKSSHQFIKTGIKLNPLTLMSDQDRISPDNINTISTR